jgi:hypothetical protein
MSEEYIYKVFLYPTGGCRVETGGRKYNYYGWNGLWMVSENSYTLTLTDGIGNIIHEMPVKINDPVDEKTIITLPSGTFDVPEQGIDIRICKGNGPIVTIRNPPALS